MKYIQVLLVLLLCKSVTAQNEAYCILDDLIFHNSDNRTYNQKKEKFLKLEKEMNIDPWYELYFIESSIANNDTIFFKDRIQELIKDHGYRFSRTDTLRYRQNPLHDLIFENELDGWLLKVSDSLYPEWIKKNPLSFELTKRIEKLRVLDQTRGTYYKLSDSCSQSKEFLKRIDLENLANLIMICKLNDNKVPNAFDVGFDSGWSLILLHNLRKGEMFETWNRILPYIENAYFAGEVSDGYFRLFDQILVRETGFQYYGFEGDEPVKDSDGLKMRRSEYNFCD